MIQSFKDGATQEVFEGRSPKGIHANILSAARRKLAQLNAAASNDDMKAPPGNRLHPLTGDRAGQHAVWINDQYRLIWAWGANGPEVVEITDYH
jgi:proteic killer suppression protein